MRLCSKYISRKVFFNLCSTTLILVSLIWFSRAVGFVRYVTENGVKISHFFSLFLLILPWILMFLIPVSLLFSILLSFNKLINSNELTIFKNSGLNKMQICRPTFKIIIGCSLICFGLSFYLMPLANQELRFSRSELAKNYAALSFAPKTFENLNNLTIYSKEHDSENNLVGLLLNDERSAFESLTITAKKGYISSSGNSAYLYMEDGTIQRLNKKTRKSEIIIFDNYVFNLSERDNSDFKVDLKPREQFFFDLLYPSSGFKIKGSMIDDIRSEIHQRIAYPLLSINFGLIALAFIMRGSFSRHGNMRNIVFAAITATALLVLMILSYSLIERTAAAVPILYLIMALFFFSSLRMLKKE